MAILLKGKPVADKINNELVKEVDNLKKYNVTPALMIIRVGNRDDDLAYERNIEKRCNSLNIDVYKSILSEDCTQEELEYIVRRANSNSFIHGILLFRPLPKQINEKQICSCIDPLKDIDGITSNSLCDIFTNSQKDYAVPCTAEACLELLSYYGYNLDGSNIVVIGRSLVVGKPLSMMLQNKNATVTMCHSHTNNLEKICQQADIVIAAAGCPALVKTNAVNVNQIIVDVGINWSESAHKIVGDVDFDKVEPIVNAITPVPGGVGAITTAILAKHVVAAAKHLSLDS